MVAGGIRFFSFKSTGFTSSTFPIQLEFSQNQPAAITLNTGSPRTLFLLLHMETALLLYLHSVSSYQSHVERMFSYLGQSFTPI